MKMKYLFLILCIGFSFTSCKSHSEVIDTWGNTKIEKEVHDGILYLKISENSQGDRTDTIVNTGISVYHRYKLYSIEKKYLILENSDIGCRVLNKSILGHWKIFMAQKYTNDKLVVFVIFVGDVIQTSQGAMCSQIDIMYTNGEITTSVIKDGKFPVYKKNIEFTSSNTFVLIPSGQKFHLE